MKKKICTFIYLALLILVMYVFQIFVINNRDLFGVKPNLILISVTIVSIWYGLYAGSIYSFLIGLITDLMFYNEFGYFTIAYSIVGSVIGFLNNNYRRENKLSLVYVTIISTAIFEFAQYVQYLFITGIYNNLLYLLKQIFLSSILNIIIVYIIYGAVSKIIEYFDDRFNTEGYF